MHHMDDPLYDNIAAFTAGLVASGVKDVVISPGSRSTPLSITLHAHPELRTWIQLDERSAGFFALGMARVSGMPSVLVCTSGTAAANYLPAVVEAHHAGVPMIVCTADRPPELQGWGAGQTIDQHNIFGTATRWSAEMPVAGEWTPAGAERAAMRAVASSAGARPGPVHLNWPFRLPLEPYVTPPVRDPEFSPRFVDGADAVSPAAVAVLEEIVQIDRGVIVVGPSDGLGLDREHETAAAVANFAQIVGWPVLAEPITQMRRTDDHSTSSVIANAGKLLEVEQFAALHAADLVIRIGRAPTTKSVRLWMQNHQPSRVVLVDQSHHWHEPSFTITDHLSVRATSLLRGYLQSHSLEPHSRIRSESTWMSEWKRADRAAAEAIDAELSAGPLMAGLVARRLTEAMPDGSILVTSNSMPVRDLDTFVGLGSPRISVIGNRGASGIDGITSTALGAAAAGGRPTALLIGDLALLHDLGGLTAARRLGLHLTAVCVDNDGGEIFSMLPIAEHGDDVDFDTLFRTAHGIEFADLDGFAGVEVTEVSTSAELDFALGESLDSQRPGVDLIVVKIDADADMDQHRRIGDAVARASTR